MARFTSKYQNRIRLQYSLIARASTPAGRQGVIGRTPAALIIAFHLCESVWICVDLWETTLFFSHRYTQSSRWPQPNKGREFTTKATKSTKKNREGKRHIPQKSLVCRDSLCHRFGYADSSARSVMSGFLQRMAGTILLQRRNGLPMELASVTW